MLTVEYRVNGQLIAFTNIHNVCDSHGHQIIPEHKCGYEFDHHTVDISGARSGYLLHDRRDGFEVLVKDVLAKITKGDTRGKKTDIPPIKVDVQNTEPAEYTA